MLLNFQLSLSHVNSLCYIKCYFLILLKDVIECLLNIGSGLEYPFIPYVHAVHSLGDTLRDDSQQLVTKKGGKYNNREIQGALETHNQDRSVPKCRDKISFLKVKSKDKNKVR